MKAIKGKGRKTKIKAPILCPRHKPCPICFGCRNYHASMRACTARCKKQKRVCNKKRHPSDMVAKMLTKEIISPKGAPV